MDVRETLPSGGSFYAIVVQLFNDRQKAAILYEDNGVTRANGFIEQVFEKDGKSIMKFDNGLEVDISKLYAINGMFSSDYSEC
jgi:hypothetical protein